MFVRKVFKYIAALVYLAAAIDAVTIQLDIGRDKCSEDRRTHYVFEGSVLTFQVPNNFSVELAWCQNDKKDRNNGLYQTQLDNGKKMFSISNVSLAMNTTLKCTILRNILTGDTIKEYHYNGKRFTPYDCRVIINVIYGNVKVTTNGLTLGAHLLDPIGYYAKYTYNYQDGEIVETTCSRLQNEGSVRIEYHDANNTKLFSVNSFMYSINPKFRSLMKLERNNSYLDCFYQISTTDHIFVHRTHYIIKPSLEHAISTHVCVNGLKLVHTPVKKSNTTLADYQYYYISGEQLDIECRVNNGAGSAGVTRAFKKRYYNYPTVTEYCGDSPNTVDITFISDLASNGMFQVPRISGLRANDILYQFTSGVDQWTIYYQHNYTEPLHLTCVYNTTGMDNKIDSLLWEIQGHPKFNSFQNNTIPNIISNPIMLMLNDTHTKTIIKCFGLLNFTNQISNVVLIVYAKSGPVVYTPTEGDNNRFKNETETIDDEASTAPRAGWVIAIATVCTVFIMAGLCVPMACWCMRTRVRARLQHSYYENMYEDERPIPIFPSQWNNYDELGPHYAEIDYGYMVNNGYYQGDLQGRLSNGTQNYYSELNVPVVAGGGISVQYTKGMINLCRGGDKYSNVLVGGRYANTNTRENCASAEPAYCSSQVADARRAQVGS